MNGPPDRGSAAVEFLLVSVLLVAMTLAVLQVAFVAHIRAVAIDSAIAGAAHAALADTTDGEGVDRTRELISRGISAGFVREVDSTRVFADGRELISITVTLEIPGFGPWLPLSTTRVTGRAVAERLLNE